MTSSRIPPGPRGRELLRTIAGRRRDPVALLVSLRESYGPVVHIRVGDTSQFVVSAPDAIRHVLVDNSRNYTKGPAYELLGALLGRGLVTSEGEHWRAHRRLVQPTLHRDRLDGYVDVIRQAAQSEIRALNAIAAGGVATFDAYARMNSLALRIVTRTMLGADIEGREDDVHHALGVVFDHIESLSSSRLRFLELLPGGSRTRGLRARLTRLPTRARRRFDDAIGRLDAIIFDVIEARRRDLDRGGSGTDLVSALLQASDVDAAALDDRGVRDEVMTMFVAGHETVATALTWTLYLLASHPGTQDEVAREAETLSGAADVAAVMRLEVTRRVVEESMRLYPPIWRLSRFAVDDDVVDGYRVPAGSVVVVSPFVVHRDPALWPDPERFDPDRFLPDRAEGRERFAYVPFGAGQRMCPGGGFAMLECLLVLGALCRSLRFGIEPSHVPAFEPRIALRPAGGMPLTVEARA